jgi:hypothetical protein
MAFVVHGSRGKGNGHTQAHTHVVEAGQIFAVFILVPHWHYDGGSIGTHDGGRGWVGDSALELARSTRAIDACTRARPIHVMLLSGCRGSSDLRSGPRTGLFHELREPRQCQGCYQDRRWCMRMPWIPSLQVELPSHLAAIAVGVEVI